MKKTLLCFTAILFSMSTVQAAPDTKRPDLSKLCQGKAINSKVSSKQGDRIFEGTCQIGFKANNSQTLERGTMRDTTIQNVCKGKTKGAATVAKVGGKNIAGKCDITFKSNTHR